MSAPTWKYRAGSVSVGIWNNETVVNGKTVVIQKAVLDRRYKDQNGNWKSSNSYGRHEIPLAILSLLKAFAAMVEKDSDEEGSS